MDFLNSILGAIAGPALGGIMGGLFGNPAAQAQQQALAAQTSLTNTLNQFLSGQVIPAEQQGLSAMQGLISGLPAPQIVQQDIAQLQAPVTMPTSMQAQGQYAISDQTAAAMNQLDTQLRQAGITGPAAEALKNNLRMQGVQAQAGYAANVGEWEAQQTMARQGQALQDVVGLTAAPAELAAQLGKDTTGTAGAFNVDLSKLFGQQAAGAASPWVNMGTALGGAINTQLNPPNTAGLPLPPDVTAGYAPGYGVDTSGATIYDPLSSFGQGYEGAQ